MRRASILRIFLRALAAGVGVSVIGWVLPPFGVLTTPGIVLAWLISPHPAIVLLGSCAFWTILFCLGGILVTRLCRAPIESGERP